MNQPVPPLWVYIPWFLGSMFCIYFVGASIVKTIQGIRVFWFGQSIMPEQDPMVVKGGAGQFVKADIIFYGIMIPGLQLGFHYLVDVVTGDTITKKNMGIPE